MASPHTPSRPLSPHLSVWKLGVHMTVSILHRITGDGMATVGTVLLVWWLAALAGGAESYAAFRWFFTEFAGGVPFYVFGIGLTFALFQHIASGVRHLVMDTGAGYELKANRAGAWATFVFSVMMTALFWGYLLGVK